MHNFQVTFLHGIVMNYYSKFLSVFTYEMFIQCDVLLSLSVFTHEMLIQSEVLLSFLSVFTYEMFIQSEVLL